MKKKIIVLSVLSVLLFSCSTTHKKYIYQKPECVGNGVDCGTGFIGPSFEIMRYMISDNIELHGDTIAAIKRIWDKLIITERLADSLTFELNQATNDK